MMPGGKAAWLMPRSGARAWITGPRSASPVRESPPSGASSRLSISRAGWQRAAPLPNRTVLTPALAPDRRECRNCHSRPGARLQTWDGSQRIRCRLIWVGPGSGSGEFREDTRRNRSCVLPGSCCQVVSRVSPAGRHRSSACVGRGRPDRAVAPRFSSSLVGIKPPSSPGRGSPPASDRRVSLPARGPSPEPHRQHPLLRSSEAEPLSRLSGRREVCP